MEKNTKRYDQLQFLRFLAFFAVLKNHGNNYYPQLPFKVSTNLYTQLAISFFFVLSGFVYGVKYCDDKKSEISVKNFFKPFLSFLKKTFPLHVVLFVLYLARENNFWLALSSKNYQALFGDIKVFGCNFLLLQSWFDKYYYSLNGVTWFLSTMLFLRLITMALIWVFKKIQISKKGDLKLLFIYILFIVISYFNCARFIGANVYTIEFNLYIFPPSRVFEYGCGIILGLLIGGKKFKVNKLVATLIEIASIALMVALLKILPYHITGEHFTRNLIWIVPVSIMLLSLCCFDGYLSKLFSLKPLKILGDLSFEAFMIHFYVINSLQIDYWDLSNYGKYFTFVYILITTYILSFIAHYALDYKTVKNNFKRLVGKEN